MRISKAEKELLEQAYGRGFISTMKDSLRNMRQETSIVIGDVTDFNLPDVGNLFASISLERDFFDWICLTIAIKFAGGILQCEYFYTFLKDEEYFEFIEIFRPEYLVVKAVRSFNIIPQEDYTFEIEDLFKA